MKIFCSGIGGIGLSAYAAYQKACGHDVSGSDYVESALLDDLRSQGISVTQNQDGSAVPEDADLFVFTLALPEGHAERMKATELGIKQQTYFEALGDLTRESGKKVIAVCGTHGKSSTTAMAAKVLIDAGKEPSVILGSKSQDLNGKNWRRGSGDYFLVEACEYRRSFLHLSPDIILMTNVDGDHFDYFKSVEDYQDAFIEFLGRLPKDGVVISHGQDADCVKVVESAGKEMIDADRQPRPSLTGQHMMSNGTLVLALAEYLDVEKLYARGYLESYTGIWRRMEIKGKTEKEVPVIDDYAHHPKEIEATIAAAIIEYPNKRIVCLFQPHLHERTRTFYDQFPSSFRGAAVVVISDVYEARKEVVGGKINVKDLAQKIKKEAKIKGSCVYGGSLSNCEKLLRKKLRQGDVLVTMGAGDVWKVADALTASLLQTV